MMNKPEDKKIAALKDAAKNKREATIKRVNEALETMQKQEMIINFESVAKFANVSKKWLYQQPEFVVTIKELRSSNKRNHYLLEFGHPPKIIYSKRERFCFNLELSLYEVI